MAANLYIAELKNALASVGTTLAPALPMPPLAVQNISFTVATQSAAFGANTRVLYIVSIAPCFLAFGAAPVATVNDLFLPANVPILVAVIPGQKLSVLAE